MRKLLIALVLGMAVVGCEGAAGPAGPAGPKGDTGAAGASGLPGPAGAAGVGTRANYVVTISSSGSATVFFPAAVGNDPTKPPALACYLSNTGSLWLAVSDGFTSTASPYCFTQLRPGETWGAGMNNAPAGWFAVFVVVY